MMKTWRILVVLALSADAMALAQNTADATPRFDYESIDSIVLERPHDQYLGHMPSYRITITRAGDVRYVAGPSAPRRTSTAPLEPGTFGVLIAHARSTAFAELPDILMRDKRFCPFVATDAATVTVILHVPGGIKRVIDYHGCPWAPAALRDFERAIERAAGVDPFKRQ